MPLERMPYAPITGAASPALGNFEPVPSLRTRRRWTYLVVTGPLGAAGGR